MKTQLSILAALTIAAAPAVAQAKPLPTHSKLVAAKKAHKAAPPRVICICDPYPVTNVPVVVEDEAQFEAQANAEAIAEGMDPPYPDAAGADGQTN